MMRDCEAAGLLRGCPPVRLWVWEVEEWRKDQKKGVRREVQQAKRRAEEAGVKRWRGR